MIERQEPCKCACDDRKYNREDTKVILYCMHHTINILRVRYRRAGQGEGEAKTRRGGRGDG